MNSVYKTCLILCLMLLLAACDDSPKAQKLTQTFTFAKLRVSLPEGWREDTRSQDLDTGVMGGKGFAAADFEGFSYLRPVKGATLAILTEWEPVADASKILEDSFAREISPVKPIQVLGYDGTYAYGKIDQGQAIGAVHVLVEENNETRQYAFVMTAADYWHVFEPTFFAIIDSLQFVGS